jgi:hypothetical protein
MIAFTILLAGLVDQMLGYDALGQRPLTYQDIFFIVVNTVDTSPVVFQSKYVDELTVCAERIERGRDR